MSELQKLSVFWNESASYLLVYGGYAVLVCAAVFVVETRPRNAGSALARLALHNLLLAAAASLLFALSLLVLGWYAAWLGGELGAYAFCVAVSSLALYFLKARSIEKLSVDYRSARAASAILAMVLAAPFAFGALFVLLLGTGMRN